MKDQLKVKNLKVQPSKSMAVKFSVW